jgi:hypothetical protein
VVLSDQGDEGLLVTGEQAFNQCGLVIALPQNARLPMPLHYCVRDTNPAGISKFPVTGLDVAEL